MPGADWRCKSWHFPKELQDRFFKEIKEPTEEELSADIQELERKIDALQKDFDLHVSGKYGVLYVPTKEEIIQITKEQIIEELRKVNKK